MSGYGRGILFSVSENALDNGGGGDDGLTEDPNSGFNDPNGIIPSFLMSSSPGSGGVFGNGLLGKSPMTNGAIQTASATDEGDEILGGEQRRASKNTSSTTSRDNVNEEPDKHIESKELDNLRTQLEEMEVYTDSFSIPSTVRSDVNSLWGTMVETILILIAVQHSSNLNKSAFTLFVAPLLFLLVYLSSQIKYTISHWNRRISLVRRRMAKSERDELSQLQNLQHKRTKVIYTKSSSTKTTVVEEGKTYTLPGVHNSKGSTNGTRKNMRHNEEEEEEQEESDYANYSIPYSIRKQFPNPATYTLNQVRLSSSEVVFNILNKILYLVNIYITFLLIKVVLDKINSSFSDGIWILSKLVVLANIVVPVYVEFQTSSYRQDIVSRMFRIG